MSFSETGAVGIFIVLFLIVFACVVRSSVKNTYDERQQIYRGKGCRFAFIVLLLCNLVYGLVGVDTFPADPDLMVMVIGVLGVGTYCVYCIWKDAYIGLRQNWKTVAIPLAVIGVLDLYSGITALLSGKGLEDGRLTENMLSLFIGILFVVICGALVFRNMMWDKDE